MQKFFLFLIGLTSNVLSQNNGVLYPHLGVKIFSGEIKYNDPADIRELACYGLASSPLIMKRLNIFALLIFFIFFNRSSIAIPGYAHHSPIFWF